MYRKFIKELETWEGNQVGDPLMVIGARQIGKTWLIDQFCRRTYKNYIYINLEERADLRSAFDGNLDPVEILRNLSIILGRNIDKDCTLFIDEIQECERAIESLKYFSEATDNYRVLCAGSLLGVKLNRMSSSFPVGKVRIHHMHPMDFEEFLLACDEPLLTEAIREASVSVKALPEGIHDKAMNLYRDYLLVGGMPKAVENYLNVEKNISRLDNEIHNNLRFAYLADMSRYVANGTESTRIHAGYESVSRQLARTNPKFKYTEIARYANKRDYSTPIDWLDASGMIIKVNRLDAVRSPLGGYVNNDSFKIYLSDTGMLANMCGLKPRDIMLNADNEYKGAVTENYCMQQFVASGIKVYYFKPSDSMEIDAVFDDGDNIVPVEIKSGRHKRSVSLKNYMEKYSPAYAIRISEHNFGKKDKLISIPLYATYTIGKQV